MENGITGKNCILIVDDNFINRELLKNIFSSQFTFFEAENGEEGLLQIEQNSDKLCAIILDVEMPLMSGIEVLEIISKRGTTEKIPTFLITAHDDSEIVERAYRYGVIDVLSKPVAPIVVERRVKTVIELFSARERLNETVKGQEAMLSENAREMDQLHRGTLEALATAIEFRDIESGQHISRIYGMTKYILTHTAFGDGLSDYDIENIARGSIMHDVGKISISDVILNKPGKLSKEEFEIMKNHTVKGAELLEQISKIQSHPSYAYAAEIARHHHEKWDGKGYPDGLKGDEISIASQVVSIVDVYDALVSTRVYKPAYSHDEAVAMILRGECGAFNPKLLECFLEAEPVIRKWYTSEGEDSALIEMTGNTKRPTVTYTNAAEGALKSQDSAVTDVMLIITAIQSAYDMIIYANLTQNSYRIVDYDRFLTHCADSDGSFDDLIKYGASSIPLSHRKEFEDTFSRLNLLRAYNEGKKSVMLEHPQYSDDGKLHRVLTKVLFVKDNRTGDILEITLSQYIDREYAERTRARKVLTDALQLAEQANSAKFDFLSKMSHDIRTPLNAIIGMATIISAHLDDKDKISSCLVKIGTSSKYLLGIINNILDYTKIESGSLSLTLSDFNIRDLVTEITSDISESANEKHQSFNVTVDENIANSYVGDEYRIKQVVMNLLDNANRFTPEGSSFSLHVGIDNAARDHDVIVFTVKDTGIGIRPEFISKLFEPFAQGEGADTVQSMGLGLPIARNLAHLMNGEFHVESEVGKGSVFTFEIPLEKGKLTALSESINTDINVLVVDDEILVCEQAAVLLSNMGISAEKASSGAEAVELVKKYSGTEKEFDVTIVDWKMPVMDGIETVRRIRKAVRDDVLVVVMSAYDWSDIESEARAAGVDLFLTKPITETNLRTTIACSERIIRDQHKIVFNGEKVLVAEDNDFNAEIAKAILEMKNLKVEIVPDGKAAYEKFTSSEKGEYLAVLMDILMPVMSGHEATKAIRNSSHPEAKTIPIYAMTANAFRTDILEAKLSGMNGHIPKPVDFDEVARILHDIAKRRS